MPDEKKISKVVYHLNSSDTTGTTWMDTTDKTVTTTNLFRGATALAASGQSITGAVDFNVSNNDGTKTLGSMDINDSTGNIEATFIDIDVMQYYNGTSNFPATGSNKRLYVDTTTGALYAWDTTDGYYQVGGTEVGTPSITIGAGTSSAAPTVNVTLDGKSGTAQSITTATTGRYGVTKLSSSTSSTSTSLAATASAVRSAYVLANGKQDPITFNTTYDASTNKAATMTDITNAVSGLTGAMHFIGSSSTAITDGGTQNPTIGGSIVTTKNAGDVVLYSGAEFVWTGSAWELLGDEGSYALKTNTSSVIKTATLTKNTLPTLTITDKTIPNVTSAGTAPSMTKTNVTIPNITSAGTAATFAVSSGTLTITPGSAPSLGTDITATYISAWDAGSAATLGTDISVGSASGWNAGSQASLSTSNETVVVP